MNSLRHLTFLSYSVAGLLLILLLCAGCGGASTLSGAAALGKSATSKPPPPPPPPADPAICYIASGVGLMVMNSDGSNQRKVYGGGARPCWSPDGSKLAFNSSNSLWTISLDGTGLFEVLRDETAYLGVANAAWSPAQVPGRGSRIAYATYALDSDASHTDIWLISPEGGARENITNTPDEPEGYPAWSPDGKRLAYERHTYLPDGTVCRDLWVHDFMTNTAERVEIGGPFADRTTGPIELDWARTQDKIAFIAGFTKQPNVYRLEIWVVDLNDPANPVKLASDPSANLYSPSWSTNDSQIVYCRRPVTSGGKMPGSEIWKMNSDGSNSTLLLAPSGKVASVSDPDWKR